jgi:N-formylglutamate deformylase
MNIFEFHRGTLPLLISVPHAGLEVPEAIGRRLTTLGRELIDTDWYVDQLYAFARELGASIIKANYSRYVVDMNRAADSSSLYVANPTSPVCTTLTFTGEPIYMSGQEPEPAEIGARVEEYWRPYHEQIAAELARIKQEHGSALLWDAHSIASEVPGLFNGVLPEFNLGTRDHASCPREVANALLDIITTDGKYGAVLNGRFKGGYITHHYGRPADGVYAVQLELSQRTYMNESPRGGWQAERAQPIAELIAQLLARYLKARPGG